EQARELSAKKVEVVATESIPQGIAALLAFNHEADFEANIRAMGRAREEVRTIEITRAVRKAKFGDLVMAKGQPIGFLDDELVAAADSMFQVIDEVLGKMDLEQSEIITLYYGADTEDAEAEQIAEALRQKYPQLEVEVIYGGQPHYNYILSLE
ncbi:MAG: DAK2 domain-containing protein, partial [Chloroflexi bacterium]|nr:DAK2 domain-containing protein [Chloroflexota bacterium]